MSSKENWNSWIKQQIGQNGDSSWNDSGNGPEVFTDIDSEYQFPATSVGLINQSARGRICLLGEDRVRFLNGQVTNQLDSLPTGYGVIAGLVNSKGKLEADLNIYILKDEILIDFEPGLTEKVVQRLDKYIIADDVEIVDVSDDYGAISLVGPQAKALLLNHPAIESVPETELGVIAIPTKSEAELVLIRRSRWGMEAYDVLAPWEELMKLGDYCTQQADQFGAGWVGLIAQEQRRIEAGWPRYGVDMDESNLAPETGLEKSGISYNKGCYIGQEVIARIRTYGQVAKSLRGFWLPEDIAEAPKPGDELFNGARKVGYLTSVLKSPKYGRWIALGYARKECNQPGSKLKLGCADSEVEATVVSLPFEHVQDPGAV